jgi:glycosyltransferase involved in cell wall biosynthesis
MNASAKSGNIADVERPFFSIITACYNAAATIEDTIISVRNQTGVLIEHIIVDGQSTDGTMEIVQRHKDGFAKIISEKDRGVYDAMQKGLPLARGHFVGFLNADDFYTGTDVLSRLAAVLQSGDFIGISGVVEQIDANEKVKRVIGRKPLSNYELLWGKFPPHPSTFLRAELMKQAGGFKHDYRIAGDFDLLLRVLKLSPLPMAHVPWTVTRMRMGGLSTQGLGIYNMVSGELLRALRECGYPARSSKIHARLFKKLTELF